MSSNLQLYCNYQICKKFRKLPYQLSTKANAKTFSLITAKI